MNEASNFCSELTVCLLLHKRAAKENGYQNPGQKHSRTFKHFHFLLCVIRYRKYHCVGTGERGENHLLRERETFFFLNALQASQSVESLMKLLAITFKCAPRSWGNSTAAKQGLLGSSSSISGADCSVLTDFKCFSQISPFPSSPLFARGRADKKGVTPEEQPGGNKTVSLLGVLCQDAT